MSKDILLVEDDEKIRKLIVYKLEKEGFSNTIHQASNPIEGLDLFHKYRDGIDHLICDFYLPIQNGNDLCKIVKEAKPKVKIICLTGDINVSLEDHRGDIDLVLYKPDGINQLSKAIKS